jgi:hypothetical protein
MSWLYSRALVEEFSAATCSAGAPSAPSSLTTTQQAFLSHGRTTERSRLSRYGMTLGRLMDAHGAELLTWYLADSRARTSASPARAPGWTESDLAYGQKWRELSVRFDRAACSWRTHRRLWDEELTGSSVTFPRWGMTVDGVLLARGTPALPTYASARGSSRAIPTPRASANENRQTKPSPSQLAGKHGMNLATWVMLPTPTAQDASNNGAPSQSERNKIPLNAVTGGKLNPRWVEWLMGWPINWTSLDPMPKEDFDEWELRTKGRAANDDGDEMRGLWWDRDPSEASHRPQPHQQHTGKYPDSVSGVPQEQAHEERRLGQGNGQDNDMQDLRINVSAETVSAFDPMRESELSRGERQTISRVTVGMNHRVDMLRALGNGQVPAVARLAWRLLIEAHTSAGSDVPADEVTG